MSNYRFEPYRGLEGIFKKVQQMADEFDKGFSIEYGNFTPKLDISEDEKLLYFQAELPGVAKEDIKVSINEENYLFIKGNKKRPFDDSTNTENEEQKSDTIYIKAERTFGEFSRSFLLPENIDKDSITAKFENGILNLSFSKIEPVKPKEIEIKLS